MAQFMRLPPRGSRKGRQRLRKEYSDSKVENRLATGQGSRNLFCQSYTTLTVGLRLPPQRRRSQSIFEKG